MQTDVTTSEKTVSTLGALRPAIAGAALLAVLMVLAGVPALRLALVEVIPATALIDGVRMPVWLPRLGVPFGDDTVTSFWLVDTVGALVVLGVFAARTAVAARRGRPRRELAGQVWVDTVLAVLAGWLVHAVLASFITGDRPVAYLLLVVGTALFALVWGAVAGVLTALAAAAVGAG